jgi:hypothetical protein
MTLQWAGPVLAVLTVGTIGLGHVAVRKLNYPYGSKPAPVFLVLGLGLLVLSLFTKANLTSAALGIVGMTTLWDAVEFIRQEEHIRRGHALANPDRPVESRRR